RTAGAVTLENVGTVSYATQSVGDDDLTVEKTAGGIPQVTGTVNNGTSVVPLQVLNAGALAITTGSGNDRLTVDSSNGLIDLPQGIRYDGASGFNELDLAQTGGPQQGSETEEVGLRPGMGRDTIVPVGGGTAQVVQYQNLAPVFTFVPAVT